MDSAWLKYPLVFSMTQADVDRMQTSAFGARLRDFRPLAFEQEILFGRGGFDNWAAFRRERQPDGTWKYAMPSDVHYFEVLWYLANQIDVITGKPMYGADVVFRDMLHIAENAGRVVDDLLIQQIGDMATAYGRNCQGQLVCPADQGWFYNAAMSVYYGMIAEENKRGTAIGRLIKINGLYSALKESQKPGVPPVYLTAASECLNVRYSVLFAQAAERHIFLYDHP